MVTLIGVGVQTQFADVVLHLQVRWSHVEFRRMSRCNNNNAQANESTHSSEAWWFSPLVKIEFSNTFLAFK